MPRRFIPGAAIVGGVSSRARVHAAVAAVAALAAVIAVGAAVLPGDEPGPPAAGPAPAPRAEAPPLALDLGVRDDAEARDLRRAASLYERGQEAEALALFSRHASLEARVGAAFARWPEGTVNRLQQLAGLYPRSALVQLHLGIARFWARLPGAEQAWREAADVEPDTPYAVVAGDLLHPELARGLPLFLPSFEAPADVLALPPAQQLAALERAAASGGARAKLLYGVALQRLGRPRSAERVFAAAARLAPGDAEAQVAVAVGRFTKDSPSVAFAQLGPLARRFPGEPTVRFHLGVLLLWTGRIEEAKRQLELAGKTGSGGPLASEAERYLERIEQAEKG